VTAVALLLHCAETPVSVSFPAGLSLLFFFSLRPVCLSQFPSRYSPVFFVFLSFGRFSLYPVGFSLSVSPPFPAVFSLFSAFFLFFLFFLLLHSDGIYRGRGSWNDPAPSHRCAWGGKPPLYLVTAPTATSNGDVACRTRPLCLLIIRSYRWRPVLALKHVGGRDKGKKTKLPFPCCTSRGRRRRNSAASKRHRFISFFFQHMKRRRLSQNAPFHLNENWR